MNGIILIADDEPWQRMWVARMLHDAGFLPRTVGDGGSVVEQALALEPALAILALEMPGVDGIEAARQLRILPKTRHLPILLITSYERGPALLQAALIERAELLIKPFHPDDLLRSVHRLLNSR